MARSSILAIVLTATALTACGPVNRGLESVNQPVVARTNFAFDMAAPQYGEVSASEAARLNGWFQAMDLRYGDTVYVSSAQGYGDPAAEKAVSDVAARYGLQVSPGAPVTPGVIPAGAVRVVVSRSAATVPGCPNWSRPSSPEFAESTSSNFGCATNSNMAAMVANPEDLLHGRSGSGVTDAHTANKAIGTYRAAEPTGKQPLKVESAQSEGGN